MKLTSSLSPTDKIELMKLAVQHTSYTKGFEDTYKKMVDLILDQKTEDEN